MHKLVLVVATVVFSLSASAIEFITEAQVEKHLGSTKVIEVSKYSIEALVPRGSVCEDALPSKSARAYVVKKGYDAYLYATPSGLSGLSECAKL